ncbi:hypothetical protein BDP27DRAFT_458856 [Rhodocollybia butyracea]|uniref:Uncharacterized protein n=1 Tax=Rhodocollybia butyracea TaxID=206335 RepID=A0A9P5U994_9AGAR|nr:hypothetical protein BDP27DRAFT_458856 [Rhodocollybia butyracea]
MEHLRQSSETAIEISGNNANQTVDLHIVKIFIALQFSGGIGMLILLSTALLSRTGTVRRFGSSLDISINRSRTWYSFCISWIISCFSYCLLFFCGEQFNPDENPSYGACLVQAALSYSSPPLTGATTVALLLDVWWTFHAAVMGETFGGKTVMISLLAVPYMLWIFLTTGFLIAGGAYPRMVQRDFTIAPFCFLDHPVPPVFVCTLTLALALATMVMLITLAINMYRIGKQIRHSSVHHSCAPALPRETDNTKGEFNHGRNQEQLLALIIRLIVFSIGDLIAVTISVVFVINRATGLWADLSIAALPLITVLIFGSQKDFLQLWLNLLRWFLPCLRRNTYTLQVTSVKDWSSMPTIIS